MPLDIEAYALTDTGLQRDHNEDAFDIIPERGLYVVADGMGGHASGQVASRLAVDNMRRYVMELAARPGHEMTFPVRPGAGDEERLLSNAIQWANERVFIESMKDRRYGGMGTTVVAVLSTGQRLVIGHVGDSRVYRFRDGALEQLTRDDSLLNHYIEQGRLRTQAEIDAFTERNIIVKALGLKDYVEPTITSTAQRPDDIYLLCTDGLTDQVDDWVISNVLQGNLEQLQVACETLVSLSNEAGGKDNCSVMLLRVTGAIESKRVERETVPSIPVVVTFEDDDDESTEPDDSDIIIGDEPTLDPADMPTVRRVPMRPASTKGQSPPSVDDTDPSLPKFDGGQPPPVVLIDGFDDADFRFDDRIQDPNED